MANTTVNNSFGFLSFSNILTIIFILLKVFGKITWSWWLVFLPTIISVGLGLILLFLILVGGLIGLWFFIKKG